MTTPSSAESVTSGNRKPLGLWPIIFLASVRAFYFLCGQAWFQKLGTKRKRHAAMVRRFLNEANFPAESWPEIVRNGLLVNLVEQAWATRLIDVAPLIVEGNEHIETALASGNGIILVRFHQKLASSKAISPLGMWLGRQSFMPKFAVGDRTRVSKNVPEKFSNARDLLEAQRILRRGGVVQILPDGQHGLHGVRRDFYGYQRVFRTGFAELALATQANIVPLCLQFSSDGEVRIKIFPAFHAATGITQEERIADLVNQYVSVLDEFWRNYPYLIVYHSMNKHLQTSKSESGESNT